MAKQAILFITESIDETKLANGHADLSLELKALPNYYTRLARTREFHCIDEEVAWHEFRDSSFDFPVVVIEADLLPTKTLLSTAQFILDRQSAKIGRLFICLSNNKSPDEFRLLARDNPGLVKLTSYKKYHREIAMFLDGYFQKPGY
jgi:hypothetical protein